MSSLPRKTSRPERRGKQRIQLTRALIARLGTMGAVIIDASDGGVRIEHFTRLEVGKKARFRFDWQDRSIEVDAVVVACRVHRFTPGDDGATVYQSGLSFTEHYGDSLAQLRRMVSTYVARSLAEQVANARGLGPILESEANMPVFRSGVVSVGGIDPTSDAARRFVPGADLVADRGFFRCSLIGNCRWDRKWTRSPNQPEEGFTVLATEPQDHVDQLCETYLKAASDDRRLIQLMARVSVESQGK